MVITKEQPYLVFPVSYTAATKHLVFREGNTPVYELDIPLDALHPAYEVYIPMERFAGRELTLETNPSMPVPVRAAAADEAARPHPLRPFFHYTAKQGWLNDPNGLCTAGECITSFTSITPHLTCGAICTGVMRQAPISSTGPSGNPRSIRMSWAPCFRGRPWWIRIIVPA